MLAIPQPLYRDVIGRIAAELEAAQALERDDLPSSDRSGGQADGIAGALDTARVRIPETRAARGARVRLRMKTAIRRVLVLLRAGRAHREMTHGRERPVVWNVLDDREAGTAVGAVRECVSVPPVRGVEDVVNALGTSRCIRRDRLVVTVDGSTLDDPKAALAGRLQRYHLDGVDPGQARGIVVERDREGIERVPIALDLDDHRPRGVADQTAEPEAGRQIPDERSESNPLNHAANRDTPPLGRASSRCGRTRRAARRWPGRDAHGVMRRACAPRSS